MKDGLNRLKALIICCWVLLIICFIIKLFGGNFFEITSNNVNFIRICNLLDNNYIIQSIVYAIIYCFSTYLIYLIIMKYKIKQDLWYIFLCIPASFLKDKFPVIGVLYDVMLLIYIPITILIVRNKYKVTWKSIARVIIVNLIVICFQMISLFIRNVGSTLKYEPTLINIIFQTDYYIMIILYYLYSIRKRVNVWEE